MSRHSHTRAFWEHPLSGDPRCRSQQLLPSHKGSRCQLLFSSQSSARASHKRRATTISPAWTVEFQGRSLTMPPLRIECEIVHGTPIAQQEPSAILSSLLKTIKCHLFRPKLARVEAPALALVVFIAVQTSARNPFTVIAEATFVDSGNAHLLA